MRCIALPADSLLPIVTPCRLLFALVSCGDMDFPNQALQQRGRNILTLQGPRIWPPTRTREVRNSKIHLILKPSLDC